MLIVLIVLIVLIFGTKPTIKNQQSTQLLEQFKK